MTDDMSALGRYHALINSGTDYMVQTFKTFQKRAQKIIGDVYTIYTA